MAQYSEEQLNDIYERTDGHCHICRKKLSFVNYGRLGRRAAWEVDHSSARALGGFDFLGNYLPACIPCNRRKQASSNRRERSVHGYRRKPLSRQGRKEARALNAVVGGGALALGARLLFGPAAVFPAAVVGAIACYRAKPDPK